MCKVVLTSNTSCKYIIDWEIKTVTNLIGKDCLENIITFVMVMMF